MCRAHAVAILDSALQAAAERSPDTPRTGPEVLSSEVVEQQRAEGCGVFTAYADGRVRARFVDRTTVSVDRWHECATVLHPDGTSTTVTVRTMPAS